MKKTILLFGIFILLSYSVVNSADYKSEFYDCVEHERYTQADSLLLVWQTVLPKDPELMAAKFNLLVNLACQSVIELTSDISKDDEDGMVLRLSDSTGNLVGQIKDSVIWNDSIFNKAIACIDCGIDAYPRRLDFRLGKTYVESQRRHWHEVVGTIENILDESEAIDFDWLWRDGEPLGDAARSVVSEAVFDYISQMADDSTESTRLLLKPLVEKTLTVFPHDYKVLNVMGSLYYDENNLEQALAYLQMAHKECPDDGLIASNIAYLYHEMGDNDSAISHYKEIVENGRYGDDVIKEAKAMLSSLEGQNVLSKHDYFFKYLPLIAEQIAPDSEKVIIFEEPEEINTVIAGYNNFKSPFEDCEIHSDAFEVDEMRIYVWTFPEPAGITECLYVAFVPDSSGFNVFTLEKSLEDIWVIGHMELGAHFSYGYTSVPEDVSGFVMLLREMKLLKK